MSPACTPRQRPEDRPANYQHAYTPCRIRWHHQTVRQDTCCRCCHQVQAPVLVEARAADSVRIVTAAAAVPAPAQPLGPRAAPGAAWLYRRCCSRLEPNSLPLWPPWLPLWPPPPSLLYRRRLHPAHQMMPQRCRQRTRRSEPVIAAYAKVLVDRVCGRCNGATQGHGLATSDVVPPTA